METLPWSSISCNRVCSWAADYHLHSCISCFISRLNYLSRSTQIPWLPLEHLHNFPPKPNKLAAQELQLQSVCVCVLVVQSCPTLCDPIDCSQPGSSLSPWNFSGKNTGVGCHSLLQDLPDPGIELGSPALQADSLPSEPPGKHVKRKFY